MMTRKDLEDELDYRPLAQIRAQIDGIEMILRLEPRSRVLDLGCGYGRQTIELARRGHRVLGMDASDRRLAEARHAARAERLNVHFIKNDPRQIPYRGEFDAVVALSSSFGRLSGKRDDQRALESVHRSLKPGAMLLVDQLNKEWLMRHFEPKSEQVSFDFETGRLNSLRVYTLTELKELLLRAGLRYRGCWGSFDGSAYGMDSPRMIVLAERPVETRPARRARLDDGIPKAIRIKGRR